MFERIKDCICHPRYLGKYNKDSFFKVFLILFLFLCVACAMLAGRTYIEQPFDESSALEITSKIITANVIQANYDSSEKRLMGDSGVVTGQGFKLHILDEEWDKTRSSSDILIVLNEEQADIYVGAKLISSKKYQEIKTDSFSFEKIKDNDASSIYYFKIFILNILNSSNLYFQTMNFLDGLISIGISYLLCLVFSYFLSLVINPTIDRNVRFRLCLYDSCVFFVGSFFAFLFNIDFISYIALALPLLYTLITFRHIVKVVIRR
ncbi:MAG: hypothetical protein K2I42_05050 [Anaeroplasmataceae bacterium]|nr:hypothetical protein [Anaeroplasmataceae bacterium]